MIPIANPDLGEQEQQRVAAVIDDGMLVAGDEVEQFENAFAQFTDTSHAVGTANGTAALHAALAALGIGAGDRVVTTPFSFVATANAIRFCNAEPVFADVDPETFNLDPDHVEQLAATESLDAIVVVHLYGLPADMDRFREIADEYDLALIEDAAQAHGATYRGQPVGSIGDVGCFSFYPTKNMTTGEGGMVVTDDPDVAERARQFINHGRSGHDTHVRLGHNFRMTNIAGAIGRVQLEKLPEYVEQRRAHARTLSARLADTPVTVPATREESTHAFHQYTIRYARRDELQTKLEELGVGTAIYYPRPIHQQPAYDHLDVTLPVAEQAAEEVLSVPVHPMLSMDDVETVATRIEQALEQLESTPHHQ